MYGYYLGASFVYGYIRGIVRASNMKYYDGVSEALPGQKVMAVVVTTMFSPSFAPVYLYNDVNRYFINKTGQDPKKYGYEPVDRDVISILFS
jgi:hypothetical protein